MPCGAQRREICFSLCDLGLHPGGEILTNSLRYTYNPIGTKDRAVQQVQAMVFPNVQGLMAEQILEHAGLYLRMNAIRGVIFAFVCVAFAHAQTAPVVAGGAGAWPSGVFRVNAPGAKGFRPDLAAVLPPKVVKRVEPEYPKQAENDHIEGMVEVVIVVDDKGIPQRPRIIRPKGHGFDEAAVEAVREWRFDPATRDGKPVAVVMQIDVDFHRVR